MVWLGLAMHALGLGRWGGVTALTATAPLPPNFLTPGELCGPDAMASWAVFGLQTGG